MSLEWTEGQRLRDALDWMILRAYEERRGLPPTPPPGHSVAALEAGQKRVSSRFRASGMWNEDFELTTLPGINNSDKPDRA